MKSKRHLIIFALLLCISTSLTGCIILAPFIQAWKNVGATAADRQALLALQTKKFGDALFWGKGEAALYADRNADPSVQKGLSFDRDKIKIVESKINNIEYSDDTYTAEVEYLIRFYRIPFYIVTDSKEKQVWKFHLGDNWYLFSRQPGKELSK